MEKFSNNFKKLFLLYFTKELILHSKGGEVLQLQNIMEQQIKEGQEYFADSIKTNLAEKEEKRELTQQQIEQIPGQFIHSIKTNLAETKDEGELQQKDLDFYKIFREMKRQPKVQTRRLTIPETRLPPHLQYLKPIPRKMEIDLEKLNPLIKDPAVKVIECNGPDEHIFVRGTMGTKPTNIVLSNEEINSIIKTFSQISKIPIHVGIYRVVVGRLILSAIISEVIGSKFMIKKMLYSPNFQGNTQNAPMIR